MMPNTGVIPTNETPLAAASVLRFAAPVLSHGGVCARQNSPPRVARQSVGGTSGRRLPAHRALLVRESHAILLGLAVGVACSHESLLPVAVAQPTNARQAMATELQICGFPEGQFDTSREGPPSYLTPKGKIHLGQRVPLEVRGDTTNLRVLLWIIAPKFNQTVTHASWVSTSRAGGTLVGVRLSADDFDYTFAYANAVFLDGSERGIPIGICKSDGWRPVHQIVVVP